MFRCISSDTDSKDGTTEEYKVPIIDGRNPFCQTQSGQVCRQNDQDPTIYQCDIEEPSTKRRVLTFNEDEDIELLAVGDKSGFGCSFEVKLKGRNLTCCYIHLEREEDRGKRLCKTPKQPEECRQPGGGEYKVEELDGPVGWCRLTLFEARLTDVGIYKITFPFEPARYNQQITVKVNGSQDTNCLESQSQWLASSGVPELGSTSETPASEDASG